MDSNQVLEWIKPSPLVENGPHFPLNKETCVSTQQYYTTFLMMGLVLLYLPKTRELLASLYDMLVTQKWCRLQVPLEHIGGCLLDV